MSATSIVVARPRNATQLVLLFHGVGASASDLVPLGDVIARSSPDAVVVSVAGAHPSTLGHGREWFSVVGVTEQNRAQRVAQAMPLFLAAVSQWQEVTGVGPEATTLIGFSQGAIMSLEATQVNDTCPVARVIAIAGRLAEPARRAPAGLQLHLIHGDEDRVVPTQSSIDANRALTTLGARITLDVLPGLGHGIDERVLRLVTDYVKPKPTTR